MIIVFLAVTGLILGSFVNALVWRLHEQSKTRQPSKKLSIGRGRSMCPHCRHGLAAKDLVPVASWLGLGGKCRYCKHAIAWQYPAAELAAAGLFVLSYLFWPLEWNTVGVINFAVWLVMLTGFMALTIYDLRWMLLPNRIIYPLLVIGALLAVFNILAAGTARALLETLLSAAIAGGIFYALYGLSGGKWIGGGDVRLGFLIGLILGDPYLAFLMLFTASLLGTAVTVPGMVLKRVALTSKIPFGPFLMTAAIIVQLFGTPVIDWYRDLVTLSL
ncbi:MAG: prepilin peptidase [Candidatus Saccharimonadales bacterium]